MKDTTLSDFFLASAGASAAFIGLLFVALSIPGMSDQPTRTRLQHGVMATSAYFALLNIFFVSLEGLISQQSLGYAAVIVGLLGALGALGLGVRLVGFQWSELRFVGWGYFATSFIIYIVEVYFGLRLIREPAQMANVVALAH